MLNIANTGSVTVTATNCHLHDNTATVFLFGPGDHTLNLSGCQAYGNIIPSNVNGGVANFASGTTSGNQTIIATNTSFDNNQAASGAVFYLESTNAGQYVDLSNCTFLNNHGVGDGIVCLHSSSPTVGQTIIVTQVEIHNNHVDSSGGFISFETYTDIPTQFTLTQANCTGNVASVFGSVVYSYMDGSTQMTMDRVTASNNRANGNGGFANLGLRPSGDQAVTVTDSSFDSNSATVLGGVFVLSSYTTLMQSIHMIGCNVTNNTAQQGAGVYIINQISGSASTLNLSDCHFGGNTVTSFGGAISMNAFSDEVQIIEINRCLMESNKATQQGGVFAIGVGSGHQRVQLIDSIWRNNQAGTFGGVGTFGAQPSAMLDDGWYIVNNNLFENNVAGGTLYGGTLLLNQGRNISLQSNIWRNNSVTTQRGRMGKVRRSVEFDDQIGCRRWKTTADHTSTAAAAMMAVLLTTGGVPAPTTTGHTCVRFPVVFCAAKRHLESSGAK